jgi:hypothetical protein
MPIRAREAAGAAKTARPTNYPRRGRLLARAGIADAKTLLDAGTITQQDRLAQSQSAQSDLTAATPGRVLAKRPNNDPERALTMAAFEFESPSDQTGTRTLRPSPWKSAPTPLNRVLCRAISRNHALRWALSGEPRGRAAVSQPTTAGCADFGSAASTLAC